MASNKMDGGKCHGGGDVKAYLRHNDTSKERREVAAKGNEHIDTSRSHLNVNLTGDTYEERCRKYDARIAELDMIPGANIRKDRVTGQLIETPVPAKLPRDKYNDFLSRVLDIQKEMFGEKNLISADIHWDEEHEYTDSETGEERMSRVHLQSIFVPVGTGDLDGVEVERLQYKAIYSRANLKKLNNACQKMCMAEFGVDFLDGSGKSSTKTIRQLKQESAAREAKEKFDRTISNANDYYSDTIDEAQKEAEKQAAEIIKRAEIRAAQIVKDAGHEAKRTKNAALSKAIEYQGTAEAAVDAHVTKAQGAVDLLKIELAQVKKEIADKTKELADKEQELGDMDDYPEFRRKRAAERAQDAQDAAKREQEERESRAVEDAASEPQEAVQVPPAAMLEQDADDMMQEAQAVSEAGSMRRMMAKLKHQDKGPGKPSGPSLWNGPGM